MSAEIQHLEQCTHTMSKLQISFLTHPWPENLSKLMFGLAAWAWTIQLMVNSINKCMLQLIMFIAWQRFSGVGGAGSPGACIGRLKQYLRLSNFLTPWKLYSQAIRSPSILCKLRWKLPMLKFQWGLSNHITIFSRLFPSFVFASKEVLNFWTLVYIRWLSFIKHTHQPYWNKGQRCGNCNLLGSKSVSRFSLTKISRT